MPQIAFQIDLATAISFFVTGFVASWLFFRRYREESLRNRVVTLDAKSLDHLFRSRDVLVDCVDRFEDLPDDVDDTNAQAFYTSVRSVRRNVRHLVSEFLLFGQAKKYDQLAAAFEMADRDYEAWRERFERRNLDNTLLNRYKSFLYMLLEEIEALILESFMEAGHDRAANLRAVKSRYGKLRETIERQSQSAG